METYYLIDYENVNEAGLEGCDKLTADDHVVLFYTDKANKISVDKFSMLRNADLVAHKAPVRKQSVDMHLVSYLGYLIGTNSPEAELNYVIVSKDTDYDNIISFWADNYHIKASRRDRVTSAPRTLNSGKMPASPKAAAAAARGSSRSRTRALRSNETGNAEIPNANGNGNGKALTQAVQAVQTAQADFSAQTTEIKNKLYDEVYQTLIQNGQDETDANLITSVTLKHFGDERFLSEVHNELALIYKDKGNEYYALLKPVLYRFSASAADQEALAKARSALNTEIQRLLADAGKDNSIINFIASLVVRNQGMKGGKQAIYRATIAKYGQKKGLSIYNLIRKNI